MFFNFYENKEVIPLAKIKTVENRIYMLEGFRVRFMKNGKDVRSDKGGIPQWDYDYATKGAMTVASWRDKFHRSYPGFECDILLGNGSVAYGNVLLENVRRTY